MRRRSDSEPDLCFALREEETTSLSRRAPEDGIRSPLEVQISMSIAFGVERSGTTRERTVSPRRRPRSMSNTLETSFDCSGSRRRFTRTTQQRSKRRRQWDKRWGFSLNQQRKEQEARNEQEEEDSEEESKKEEEEVEGVQSVGKRKSKSKRDFARLLPLGVRPSVAVVAPAKSQRKPAKSSTWSSKLFPSPPQRQQRKGNGSKNAAEDVSSASAAAASRADRRMMFRKLLLLVLSVGLLWLTSLKMSSGIIGQLYPEVTTYADAVGGLSYFWNVTMRMQAKYGSCVKRRLHYCNSKLNISIDQEQTRVGLAAMLLRARIQVVKELSETCE